MHDLVVKRKLDTYAEIEEAAQSAAASRRDLGWLYVSTNTLYVITQIQVEASQGCVHELARERVDKVKVRVKIGERA